MTSINGNNKQSGKFLFGSAVSQLTFPMSVSSCSCCLVVASAMTGNW